MVDIHSEYKKHYTHFWPKEEVRRERRRLCEIKENFARAKRCKTRFSDKENMLRR